MSDLVATRFIKRMHWVLELSAYKHAHATALKVLDVLVRHESWVKHTGWVGNATIAKEAGCSSRSVVRAIGYWDDCGLLRCSYKWMGAGWRRFYHLAWTPDQVQQNVRRRFMVSGVSAHRIARCRATATTKYANLIAPYIKSSNCAPLIAPPDESVSNSVAGGSDLESHTAQLKEFNKKGKREQDLQVFLSHRQRLMCQGRFHELPSPAGLHE